MKLSAWLSQHRVKCIGGALALGGVVIAATLVMNKGKLHRQINQAGFSGKPLLVAHGATVSRRELPGLDHNIEASNALEPLNVLYARGFRLFEIDFCWTSDNHLVAIHDWDKAWRDYFTPDGVVSAEMRRKPRTLQEFKSTKMRYGLTQLTAEGVLEWLRDHPDAAVVTDIKSDNLKGLKVFVDLDRQLATERIIPQIYHFKEHDSATALGYKRIIFTIYRATPKEEERTALLEFIRTKPLYAVTLHIDKIRNTDLAESINQLGAFIYAYPVSEKRVYEQLKAKGVHGLYTKYLRPDDPTLAALMSGSAAPTAQEGRVEGATANAPPQPATAAQQAAGTSKTADTATTKPAAPKTPATKSVAVKSGAPAKRSDASKAKRPGGQPEAAKSKGAKKSP